MRGGNGGCDVLGEAVRLLTVDRPLERKVRPSYPNLRKTVGSLSHVRSRMMTARRDNMTRKDRTYHEWPRMMSTFSFH